VSDGRDLAPLFAPRSIAVAGASTNPESWGYWLARAAIEGADRRPVHLVNPRGGELFGRPLRASLRELDGEADLVVVAVPERALEDTVEAALQAGARSLVVITAGLGERDSSGRARELALRDRVRAAGALMLGPNCIGIFDAAENLRISSNEYPAGPVGLISQSGNLSLEVGLLLGRCGLGLSRFASVGNQADVTLPDLLLHLAEHDATRAIAVYVEDVADGRAFVEAARAATRRKPVVVLAAGTSEAGRRGAASHTGALVSGQAVLRAACEAAGALLVDSPGALADAVYALVRSPLPRGRRVAVIGDGGGHGAVCADLLTAHGLHVPRLSERLIAQLDAALPPHGGIDNPVDLIGVGESELTAFSTAARVVLASGEIDAVAVTGYFGGYALYSHDYVRSEPAEAARLVGLQESTGSPVVAHSMYAPDSSGAALRATGLAVFERTEQAVRALRALVTVAEERSASAPLPLPPAASPLAGVVGYVEARALLVEAGLPYPDGAVARDAAGAAAVADRLGLYPATLKAVDPALVHKSDRGGVRVGLPDAASLHAAALEMERVLAPERLFVERTAIVADGVELIVGARQDARFGPVVLVGLGGTLVEVLGDTALALAPLDPAAAGKMLASLRGAPLLLGVRGRAAVDLDAAAAAISALSHVAAAHPELAELEVNPLLVTPSGAYALDARAILEPPEEGAS
jgi:acyl-CoA synthetase (NDP forming)